MTKTAVAGRIAVIGFDEGFHFLVFLEPAVILRHTGQINIFVIIVICAEFVEVFVFRSY